MLWKRCFRSRRQLKPTLAAFGGDQGKRLAREYLLYGVSVYRGLCCIVFITGSLTVLFPVFMLLED